MKPSRQAWYASPARRDRERRGYARAVGGLGLSVDASELAFLADRLAMVPREMHKEVRPRLAEAGQRVKASAAANASWSSRIPGALTSRVRLTGNRPGVYVQASSAKAPHARPFEGMTGRNPFRHPVFGNGGHWAESGNVWVAQAARPFLVPALRENDAEVKASMGEAVMAAFRKAGVTN